jgi:hypothetical protein
LITLIKHTIKHTNQLFQMPNCSSTAYQPPLQELLSQNTWCDLVQLADTRNGDAMVIDAKGDTSKDGVYMIQGDALTGERMDCSQTGGQIAEQSRGRLKILSVASLFHTQLAAYLAIHKATNAQEF